MFRFVTPDDLLELDNVLGLDNDIDSDSDSELDLEDLLFPDQGFQSQLQLLQLISLLGDMQALLVELENKKNANQDDDGLYDGINYDTSVFDKTATREKFAGVRSEIEARQSPVFEKLETRERMKSVMAELPTFFSARKQRDEQNVSVEKSVESPRPGK